MPGIVSISVPSLGESASHAVVTDLSTMAQERVAAMVDTADEGMLVAHTTKASREETASVSRLQRGRRYLRDFDYECAERELASVLRAGSGDSAVDRAGAAESLLALYVERLARYGDAIDLFERHGELVQSSDAKLSVAIAAAQVKQLPLALELLAGLEGDGTTNTLADIATEALAESDYASARDGISRLRTFEGRRSLDLRMTQRLRVLETRVLTILDQAPDLENTMLLDLAAVVAPKHPRLLERSRRLKSAREAEDLERRLRRLESLRGAHDEASLTEAEALTRALSSLTTSSEQRVFIETVAEELAERRAALQMTHVTAIHDRGELELAAIGYLRLRAASQSELRSDETRGFFSLVEQIALAGESSHTTARAAAALATETWEKVAPFASILSRVPALETRMRELRASASTIGLVPSSVVENEKSVSSQSGRARAMLSETRESYFAGDVWVADETLEMCGQEVAVFMHRLRDGQLEIWLDPVDTAARAKNRAFTLRIVSGTQEWVPTSITSTPEGFLIADSAARSHLLSFVGPTSLAWREGPLLDVVQRQVPMGAIGGRLFPIRQSRARETGAMLHGATRPAIVAARSQEILVFDGTSINTISIPVGLGEFVAVESPAGHEAWPVLLEMTPGDSRPFVWYCPNGSPAHESLWRGFRLREPLAPRSAFTLPGRGIVLTAIAPDRGLLLQNLPLVERRLERGSRLSIADGLSILMGRTHRRVWVLRVLADTTKLQLDPFAIR